MPAKKLKAITGIGYYLNQVVRNKSGNCSVFQAAALDTWNRIAFSRTTPKLRIHETTITQNLIYEMNLLRVLNPALTYRIYESTQENVHGDDLEIAVPVANHRYVTFALQAKIIYHNFRRNRMIRFDDGRYHQLEHYSGANNQVDLLLRYARNTGSIPLYLLYNYVTDSIPLSYLCRIPFEINQYGCSVIAAQYLKDHFSLRNGNLSSKVRFSDIHPNPALPWFVLACCFRGSTIENVLKSLQVNTPNFEIKEWTRAELEQSNDWTPLKTINLEAGFVSRQGDKEALFNPQFRIIL